MKICFISQQSNISRGSYRIHIHDLNLYFNKIGIYSVINPININEFDVVIYGKSAPNVKPNNNKMFPGVYPKHKFDPTQLQASGRPARQPGPWPEAGIL